MPCTPLRRTSSALRKASIEADVGVAELQESLIGDDDQRVAGLAQLVDAGLGLAAARLPSNRTGG